MAGDRHDGNPEGIPPLAMTQPPAFLTMCPHVRPAQELAAIREFCHRAGRVKAAHEAKGDCL